MTWMTLSEQPHDEARVESEIGRHRFHAIRTGGSRKRSGGDELPQAGAVGTVLLVLVIAGVTRHAQAAQQSKGGGGGKGVTRLRHCSRLMIIDYPVTHRAGATIGAKTGRRR
jgi:hypothetical protein